MAGSPFAMHRFFPRTVHPLVLPALIALVARLLVAPFFGYRYDVASYLEWTNALARNPLDAFYGATLSTPPDHLPGDLLVFALIGRLVVLVDPGFAFSGPLAEMLIRLVPIASDILLGVLAFRMLHGKVSERVRVLAVLGIWFNPALFAVSAIWGQWDSFAALILVFIVLLALGDPRRGMLVWPVLTFLVLVKPQTVAFAPLLLIAQLRLAVNAPRSTPAGTSHHRLGGSERVLQNLVTGGVASVGVFLAATLPFGVGVPGQPGVRWSIFDRIHYSIDRYTDVALGAHNLWSMLGLGYGDPDSAIAFGGLTYQTVGLLLLATAFLATIGLVSVLMPPSWALWVSSFVLAMGIYMFPTRVHERYMLPAVVFLLFMWPLVPRLAPFAVSLSISYAISLAFAMSGGTLGNGPANLVLAMCNVALFTAASAIVIHAGTPILNLHLPRRIITSHRGT